MQIVVILFWIDLELNCCWGRTPNLQALINGGKNASYIEPFINTLKEQLLSKSSTKLIYMLNQWASKYAA